MQFDRLGRIIGVFSAHFALASVFGILWGIGLRQSIHSIMLTNRGLRRMKVDTKTIQDAKAPYGSDSPVYLRALARRNRHVKWGMRYGMLLDASAGFGDFALGIGTLFRHPIFGEIAPALRSAALPVLTGAFVPLALPSAIATLERATRCGLTFHKVRAMRRHLQSVSDPRAEQVGHLYKNRQRELAAYFAMDSRLARRPCGWVGAIGFYRAGRPFAVGACRPGGHRFRVFCWAGLSMSTILSRFKSA